MAYITLEQAKRHCNIEEVYTDDDQYVTDLIGVAETVVSQDICEDLKGLEDEEGNIPSPLKQAALLLVGHYYANREPVAFVQTSRVPLTYDHLVKLYRNYEK